MIEETASDLVLISTEIVAAYVSKNPIPATDLPELLTQVYGALAGLTNGAPQPVEEPITKATPAQIRKSITPDALISFIDGKRYQALKRHLTSHGLGFAEYRQRYGLPADYPTVAPNYSARRSELARSLGLGRPRKITAVPEPQPPVAVQSKRTRRPRKVAEPA